MYTKLLQTINGLKNITISEERKEELNSLIVYIQEKLNQQEVVALNFICTHNSRRSHFSQIWAQTLAAYFNVSNVYCYSGGTEATAMFSKVVDTLQLQGFCIQQLSDTSNPIYAIKNDDNNLPIIGFSKTFDHQFNPKSNFAAIMTCSSADVGCPFVIGAEKKFSIRYDDPKVFDGTDFMNEKYISKSLEIASEMAYVFSQVVNLKN
ncbi:protein-tyrosine-phosphatase [Flavobacterium sp. J27]|uniref:protein-tyrosine-phosphatase n=1 Tax=Flavobacterium sp. J27 TaxID=2060419 RepID=UPI0010323A5E|nr:protein-tyrosine-phosphatase [Flavobacterium sp. J27]